MKNGWKKVTVGQILQLEYGKPLGEPDRKPDGRYPVYGANGEKDRTDRFYCAKPSIIVGRKGSAGEVNLTGSRFWPLDVTFFATFDEKLYDLKFLYYLLGTLELQSLAKGVKPGINRNDVYSLDAKVPPLAEQKRIVGILDDAFNGIAKVKANAEENLQNARDLLSCELESTFVAHDHAWTTLLLGDACRLITDGKHGDCNNEAGSGYFFLSAKDVKNGRLIYDNAREITKVDFEETHRRTNLEPGDILLTNAGTIGRIAIADSDAKTRRTTFQKSVAVLKPKSDRISSRFAYYCLSAGMPKLVALSAGTAQKNLLLRDLKNHPISIPSSINEQLKISQRLDRFTEDVERLELGFKGKLNLLEELRKSLLHQAFTGQL